MNSSKNQITKKENVYLISNLKNKFENYFVS